ncbi:MAG: iron ABC transporter permease, partial [Candidatus Methanomethylophilus sp.]|nr:iron ABC transporter permease [Methanomethylophilus sp.]
TINLVLGISIIGMKNDAGIIANALLFSMIPCILMLLLSIRGKTTSTQLILIGIGVMYLFSAFTMMLKYNAEPEILNQIYAWSVGSVSKIGWTGVYCLLPTTLILFILLYILSPKIDVIAIGDNMSQSLGVDPVKTRLLCMVIISACTAIAVSFSGSIGFVGLVIPHVSRLLVGSKSRLLIPCSAVLGAFLLIGAEVVARVLANGMPVGAITAMIGAPVFLYFLFKIRTNGWGK